MSENIKENLIKSHYDNIFLKGNEALEKKFFLFVLQGKEIWRGNQKLKKKKNPLFPASQTIFGSAESELNGGERSVFLT